MKSISNESDIIIEVIASQLSGHCDVINKRLWRHQQNENRASETRGRCVKIVVLIVIYVFVMPCKKWNNVCDELFLCSLECYFGVYFTSCFATWEINTKISLLWALKQFVTWVHVWWYTQLMQQWHLSLLVLSGLSRGQYQVLTWTDCTLRNESGWRRHQIAMFFFFWNVFDYIVWKMALMASLHSNQCFIYPVPFHVGLFGRWIGRSLCSSLIISEALTVPE